MYDTETREDLSFRIIKQGTHEFFCSAYRGQNLFKKVLCTLFSTYFKFRKRNFWLAKPFETFFYIIYALTFCFSITVDCFVLFGIISKIYARTALCLNIIVIVVVVNSVVLTMGSLTNIPPNVPFRFSSTIIFNRSCREF